MHDHGPDKEPLIVALQRVIHWAVRLLAIMMVAVIIMGVVDVVWTLYQRIIEPPTFILTIPDILATFGAFMAVLIAIEIFINITIYLREDVIHVKIVIATALMAVARKVIILDMEKTAPLELFGLAALVITASIAYWLVHKTPAFSVRFGKHNVPDPDTDPAVARGAGALSKNVLEKAD
ncbi:phosphate-starvation-inducible PsiE family protein [Aliiglaciecola sp. CAU 1673]|uniref:phosphate-starvation-inducible PsiE family protein n=1 Tax=Aliiglaciecola sp. CAU 1673 TaxID=3032595 RepID=UPI0023DB4F08|nr:phosphate-starvation-inducible PsiE family protein [Aliiglaciecola sp. CAU 1673]MDF2177212.1 phosphate-starvation-inducible PsiE family protein [Aliiglaciecola sp. CAU 1673]